MTATNRYCVIMAGGIGSRFWPASRRHLPKQFLDILGTGKSFIRHTFERFAPIIPAENFLVVTNAAYRQLVLEQLPELWPEQVLCEPVGRNTAPCIAYAAFRLKALQPDSTMVVAPSDHFIFDEEEFRRNITSCMEFAETHDALVTIGIRPSRPDTGYGYIQTASAGEISPVVSFREKPDLKTAMSYLAAGNYLWNAGIFVWSARSILAALERCLPEVYGLFAGQADRFATPEEPNSVEDIFARCPSSRSTTACWNVPIMFSCGVRISAGTTSEPGAHFTNSRPRTPMAMSCRPTRNSTIRRTAWSRRPERRSSWWIRCTTISWSIRRMPC